MSAGTLTFLLTDIISTLKKPDVFLNSIMVSGSSKICFLFTENSKKKKICCFVVGIFLAINFFQYSL